MSNDRSIMMKAGDIAFAGIDPETTPLSVRFAMAAGKVVGAVGGLTGALVCTQNLLANSHTPAQAAAVAAIGAVSLGIGALSKVRLIGRADGLGSWLIASAPTAHY